MKVIRWPLVVILASLAVLFAGCGGGGTGSTNTAPTAAFTVSPTAGSTGTEFVFNASGCTDGQDLTSALQVQWDWTNDGVWDTGYSTTKTAYHTFSAAGTPIARCQVRDSGGLTGTTTRSVPVSAASLPSAICAFGAEAYSPGTPLPISIQVTPEATTNAYAVEDTPPTGWVVSNINEGGVFDSVNNKVKWGPFFDNIARTFTYTATPPGGESGIQIFSGTASFDGSDVSLVGARHIVP